MQLSTYIHTINKFTSEKTSHKSQVRLYHIELVHTLQLTVNKSKVLDQYIHYTCSVDLKPDSQLTTTLNTYPICFDVNVTPFYYCMSYY